MDKNQAKISIKNISKEAFSLNPSAIIQLFEIDISQIGFDSGAISAAEIDLNQNTIFRFHNNINLSIKSIFWQGKEYIAAPIKVEGMDMNSRGENISPKLSMSVSDEGIPQLSRLKDRIFQMGDIIGGKVIRIRTFAKFLDAINFTNDVLPEDFSSDPNSEFPRDIFYIDRKSIENKNVIEYELSSLFDVEGIKLPARLVSQDTCVAQYRGEGCLYEYASRKNNLIHGDGVLPLSAPPVADGFDRKFSDLLPGVSFNDQGQYSKGQTYQRGEFVYITHQGLNIYFLSKIDNNTSSPLNSNHWIADDCSKKIKGCKCRYGDPALNSSTTTIFKLWTPASPIGATIGGVPGVMEAGEPTVWSYTESINPEPFHGKFILKSLIATHTPGNPNKWYNFIPTVFIGRDDVLVVYVYIDPLYPATEIFIAWLSTTYEHGATWGTKLINPTHPGNTNDYRYMGALPSAGGWARLEVPASLVGLEDSYVTGIQFLLDSGRVSFDYYGNTILINTGARLPINAFPSVNRFK